MQTKQLFKTILAQMAALPPAKKDLVLKARYEGYAESGDASFGLSLPQLHKIAKELKKTHPPEILIELLDLLYSEPNADLKFLAGLILSASKETRALIKLPKFYEWLNQLHGWAELDNTCQHFIPAKELITDWAKWEKFLAKCSKSKKLEVQRASLVIPLLALRENLDERVVEFSLRNVVNLCGEKSVLITKAISWNLRTIAEDQPKKILAFMKQHPELPAIARRETLKLIETGKKTGPVVKKN